MSSDGAWAFAATFRYFGIDAEVSPESNDRTIELANQYVSGDECYPEMVTLGNYLRIMERDGFDPERVAFCMFTSTGPCRFGQYRNLLLKVLREKGFESIAIVAPTIKNSYEDLGEIGPDFIRLAWWSINAADILRKLLLKTRPYETQPGSTDRVYSRCLVRLCRTIERPSDSLKGKLDDLVQVLTEIRDEFRKIPADYSREKPLIGVVGEIFCRLNDFSNDHLIRVIERHGGEAWLANIAEWVWYTSFERKRLLRLDGKRFSAEMLGTKIRDIVQARDEHRLYAPFKEDFYGYEEPESTREILEYALPYLPYYGALGEMLLSVGGSVYFYHKGADGVVDISPFTCMNGIVCEAVFPSVSRDHDGIPIRNFYFDGTQSDLDRDVGIFMELALTYRKRKRISRRYPAYFN
jgi:predicted nucleotide-binding protein (sugar kinase/HSP70/actin superfamily)